MRKRTASCSDYHYSGSFVSETQNQNNFLDQSIDDVFVELIDFEED